MRAVFLFPSQRKGLLEKWQNGEAPDTLFLGLNHIKNYGVDAAYIDPDITKVHLFQQIKALTRDLDAIICKDVRTGYLLASLRRIGILKRRLIFTDVHPIKYAALARLFSAALKGADCLIYHAKSMETLLVSSFGIPESKFTFLPWGVDANFFNPVESDDEGFILSVGTHGRDYKTLVRAARIADVNQKIISKTFDCKGICVKKNIPYTALREAYASCSFVVVPLLSTTTSLGITAPLEAMAMGKAAIVTRSPGILDYVEDGETAMLVKPGDEKDLAEKMTYLRDNPDEAARIGKRGRSVIEKKFNTEKCAQRLAQLLEEIG